MSKIIHRRFRRGDVWVVRDKNEEHNGDLEDRKYENHVQGGTRTAVIVSNDIGNEYSPNVEVVYTTTASKKRLPTHFKTQSTPRPSTVLCEAVMTVAKTDMQVRCGSLDEEDTVRLNRCLKISLGLE